MKGSLIPFFCQILGKIMINGFESGENLEAVCPVMEKLSG
jgi:hypothetical protein